MTTASIDSRPHGTRAVNRALVVGAGAKVMVAILNALSVSIAARSLGPSGYGVLAVVSGIMATLLFLDFGIANTSVSAMSSKLEAGDLTGARGILSTAFAVLTGVGLAIAVAGGLTVATMPESWLFHAPDIPSHDIRLSLIVLFIVLGSYFPASIGVRVCYARELGLYAGVYSVLAALAGVTGVAVCAFTGAPVWMYAVATVGVPTFVLAIQTIIFVGPSKHAIRLSRKLVTPSSLRSIGRATVPYFVLGACATLSFQSNVVVVAYTLDSAAAAKLAIAMQLFSMLLGIFQVGLQQSWASSARALSAGDVTWARNNFWRVLRITSALAVAASLMYLVLARPIATLWVGEGSAPPYTLLMVLSVWACYGIVQMQASYLLNAANIVTEQAIMAVLILATSIPLGIFLALHLGIVGPTLASIVSTAVISAIPTFILARNLLRRPDGKVSAEPAAQR